MTETQKQTVLRPTSPSSHRCDFVGKPNHMHTNVRMDECNQIYDMQKFVGASHV